MLDMNVTYEEFRRLEETMNRIFGEIWGVPVNRYVILPGEIEMSGPVERYRKPFIDLIETDIDVKAAVEIPGLEKGDIKINLTEDRLEISTGTRHNEEKRERGYIYKERRGGCYHRAVRLPSSVDPDKSKALYNNGILQISMPKTESKKKILLKIE